MPSQTGRHALSGLSPALFLLVMDPLLKQLQTSGLGLSVNRYYAGGFLHANDIRTLATSEDSLQRQVGLVKAFAEENLLRLNVSKCELVLFSQNRNIVPPVCEVEGTVMPAGDVGKCLGYWWKGDLFATKSVDENIKKARRSFFSTTAVLVLSRETSAPSPPDLFLNRV